MSTSEIQLDKTYVMRNGRRVYLYEYWGERILGYGDDGIYHRFNRDGTGWNYLFMGGQFSEPQHDIIHEATVSDDLRDEHFAYQAHIDAQRAYWEGVRGLPNGYELYRKWNRAHRPPGPIGPGLREKDYD